LDETPNLITLNARDRDVYHHPAQDPIALLAGQNQELQNRGVVNASDPLDSADGASLTRSLSTCSALPSAVYIPSRWSSRGSVKTLKHWEHW